MEFKPGKLYKCHEYYLMIFQTKEAARRAAKDRGPRTTSLWRTDIDIGNVAYWTAYWSDILGVQVRCSKPGEIFMCLGTWGGEYVHVLLGDFTGWILSKNLKFKEVSGPEKSPGLSFG